MKYRFKNLEITQLGHGANTAPNGKRSFRGRVIKIIQNTCKCAACSRQGRFSFVLESKVHGTRRTIMASGVAYTRRDNAVRAAKDLFPGVIIGK